MNLSRRAKLERQGSRPGAARKVQQPAAEPIAEPAATVPDVEEVAIAEPIVAPVEDAIPVPAVAAPPADEEAPKRARFVRAAAEAKPAAKAVPLPPRSTKQSGKLMTKKMATGPAGPSAAAANKGPKGGREPITNTPKRS